MSSQITGNAGGASASGATVLAVPSHVGNAQLTQQVIADASGNFTFIGLAADTYTVQANASTITSGAFLGFVYRKAASVTVDGSTNVSGVNIPAPVAANSSNQS